MNTPNAAPIPIATTDRISGAQIAMTLGVVVGIAIRSRGVSGNIIASDVHRVRLVKTMSGDIDLSNGESDELTASTTSGNVIVSNLKGRLFDLQSVTGHVRLTNVEPDPDERTRSTSPP